MYAPPSDFGAQLVEMLVSGKPDALQPAQLGVDVQMPVIGGSGDGETDDPYGMGSAEGAFDLTGAAMDWFKKKNGSKALEAVPALSGMNPMAAVPLSGAFNSMPFPKSMLTQAATPAMSPAMLMAALGIGA